MSTPRGRPPARRSIEKGEASSPVDAPGSDPGADGRAGSAGPPAAPPGAAPKPLTRRYAMPSSKPSTVVARGGRQVACTWCGKTSEVAPSAKSVVCPHCNKRLVVEDLRVSTYQAVRLLATCGDVVIDKPGHVIAAVRAVNLTVGGKLTGDVVVLDKVVVQKTATIKGDIQASRLRVEGGATLDGYLRIGVAPRAGDAAKAD